MQLLKTPHEVERDVCRILGQGFLLHRPLSAGASHSGHNVLFGSYLIEEDYVPVAAKLFPDNNIAKDRSLNRARHESRMYKHVRNLGFYTLRPIAVVTQNEGSVLLTSFEEDLYPANVMDVSAEPSSIIGEDVARHVALTAKEIANLHSSGVTHGDAQLKNFAFKRPALRGSRAPYVVDLEKSTEHVYDNDTRNMRTASALKRDLTRFARSLAAQGFGGESDERAQKHFSETVIPSYLDSISIKNKVASGDELAEHSYEIFHKTRRKMTSEYEKSLA